MTASLTLRNTAIAIALVLSMGLFATATAFADQKTPEMFLLDTSPKSLSETRTAFEAEVKAAGWGILNTLDMAAILAKKGHRLKPVLVMEACSGKYSAQLLAEDRNRYIAPMIPCRVALYETEDGKVVISRMNAKAMAAMMTPEVAKVVAQSGEEMEDIIAKTLSKLK